MGINQPRKWDDDFDREFFTQKEIDESDARADAITKETGSLCPYCHPDSNGEYTMSSFTNDATGENFVVGMYDERLTIGYHRPGFKTVRLVVEANYCLKCGRAFGGEKP